MKIKKHKGVLIRSGLFLLLVYVVVPLIFWMIENKSPPQFKFNFFYFMIFSLMMIGMFVAYNKKRILNFKYKFVWWESGLFLLLALGCFWSYFIIKYGLYVNNVKLMIGVSYLLYFMGFILVALAIFGSRFFSSFRNSILGSLLVVYIFFMGTVAILWQFGWLFSTITAKIVHFLLSQTGSVTGLVVGAGDPSLQVGSYSAIIGAPCSGIESLAMFLGVALLAMAYDWQRIKWKKGLLVFSFGMFGIFFVNVIRVGSLMLVGTKNPDLANNLFHNNLGWIFFVIYVMVLIMFVYPKVIKK